MIQILFKKERTADMRRKDREVRSPQEIDSIVENCKVLRLGLLDEGGVYIVPVCFGYEIEDGNRSFFFHSAKEGRKVDILEKSDVIDFEMDRGFVLQESQTACGHSAGYQSIIGRGSLSRIDEFEEKKKALSAIMSAYTGTNDWNYLEKALESVYVYRIEVSEISCKENA